MMHYKDSEDCPRTYEEYERKAVTGSFVPLYEFKDVLRKNKVKGRSKLDSSEVETKAREVDPQACSELDFKYSKLYRWVVAHGLELSYAELHAVEVVAGVEPTMFKYKAGAYRNLEDVKRVYEAASELKKTWNLVRVHLTCKGPDDDAEAAIDRVIEAIKKDLRVSDGWALFDSGQAYVILPNAEE